MSFSIKYFNFYDMLDEETEENYGNGIKFHLKKNLGRKRKDEKNEKGNEIKINKRTHTKRKKDNMRSKIMTHFSKYVISFLNDYGKKFFLNQKNDFFKKVDYKLRNKVNIKSINNMMQKTLSEFCKLKVSSKHKNCENLNLDSLNLLSNYFEKNFFDKKISEFYKDFYLSNDMEKLKTVYGISKKTKNFESLLDNFNDDIEYRNSLKETGNKLIEFANQNSIEPINPPIKPDELIEFVNQNSDENKKNKPNELSIQEYEYELSHHSMSSINNEIIGNNEDEYFERFHSSSYSIEQTNFTE